MKSSLAFFYYRGGPFRTTPPLVKIENATFYRHHPATVQSGNPVLFPDFSFCLSCDVINRKKSQVWAVVGPSNSGKTTLLEILKGQHLCVPPTARSFPHLGTIGQRQDTRLLDKRDLRLRSLSKAVQYVGFGAKEDKFGGGAARGAYLAARYESRREVTDFSLEDYLKGHTDLNPADEDLNEYQKARDKDWFARTVKLMRLGDLLELPVSNLSNGQTRRARIAKALMERPRLMLLDEPFLGIDPLSQYTMSPVLFAMSRRSGPQIILALQPHDEIPKWITHLIYLGPGCTIKHMGPKEQVVHLAQQNGDPVNLGTQKPQKWRNTLGQAAEDIDVEQSEESRETADDEDQEYSNSIGESVTRSRRPDNAKRWDMNYDVPGVADDDLKEPLIEMKGVKVSYGDRTVLGNWQQDVQGEPKDGLWWNVNRGERWAIFGPNGSGKTTLLSLICSDHPQSYSLPINFWGRSRLPSPSQLGISVFDIQVRIGQSSPEIHGFFPRHLSVRQTIENSWADTFLSKPALSHARDTDVDALLRWFRPELDTAHTAPIDPVDTLTELPSHIDRPSRYTRASQNFDAYLATDTDWADAIRFGDLSFSSQRVALLLRALAKRPDLLTLDEAFSGMDARTRTKCMMFLAYGETTWLRPEAGRELQHRHKARTVLAKRGAVRFAGFEARQALVCVSHRKDEVPGLVQKWMCLPEPNNGQGVRFGEITYGMRLRGQAREGGDWWESVWGPQLQAALKRPERRKYLYD